MITITLPNTIEVRELLLRLGSHIDDVIEELEGGDRDSVPKDSTPERMVVAAIVVNDAFLRALNCFVED